MPSFSPLCSTHPTRQMTPQHTWDLLTPFPVIVGPFTTAFLGLHPPQPRAYCAFQSNTYLADLPCSNSWPSRPLLTTLGTRPVFSDLISHLAVATTLLSWLPSICRGLVKGLWWVFAVLLSSLSSFPPILRVFGLFGNRVSCNPDIT